MHMGEGGRGGREEGEGGRERQLSLINVEKIHNTDNLLTAHRAPRGGLGNLGARARAHTHTHTHA